MYDKKLSGSGRRAPSRALSRAPSRAPNPVQHRIQRIIYIYKEGR